MDLFVKCYGAEAGNFALKTLPFGGMYIAGGIAKKILWAIQKDYQFWNAFVCKGRMQSMLEKIPLFLIRDAGQVGLLGAKVVCRRFLRAKGFVTKGELTQFAEALPRMLDMIDNENMEAEFMLEPSPSDTISGATRVNKVVLRRKPSPSPRMYATPSPALSAAPTDVIPAPQAAHTTPLSLPPLPAATITLSPPTPYAPNAGGSAVSFMPQASPTSLEYGYARSPSPVSRTPIGAPASSLSTTTQPAVTVSQLRRELFLASIFGGTVASVVTIAIAAFVRTRASHTTSTS